MNNKAHLIPKDYDSNGDIIPMACKEESRMNCDLYFKAMTKEAELDKMPMISKKHKGGAK